MTIIKLGAPGALRNYSVKQRGDGLAWSRGPAKPFAAQVNTSNKWDKVDIWNEWTQESWQAGIGRTEADAGGQLFSTVDSRVPNQLVLPPLLKQCDQRPATSAIASARFMPESMTDTILIGGAGYSKAAVPFSITFGDIEAAVPRAEMSVYFYGQFPEGVEVQISIFTNSAGSPGSIVAATTKCTFFAEDYHKDFSWMGNYIYLLDGADAQLLSTATTYWLVIEPVVPAESFTLAYHDSGYATVSKRYVAGAWETMSSTYLLYTTDIYSVVTTDAIYTGGTTPEGATMFRFNGEFYYTRGADVWQYDDANEDFDYLASLASGNIISAAVYGPNVYIASDVGDLQVMSTSHVFSGGGLNATLLCTHKGYLYRAYQNNLWYTGGPSISWVDLGPVGGADSYIRGMAGMENDLFIATDKAMYRLAPGNVIEEVFRFGSESSDNGLNMLNYQGSLYIPMQGRLFQYSPSGQLIDIFLGEDDLPLDRVGRIDSLCVMNNWLVAIVSSQEATYAKPMVLAYQREGWHALATLPNEINFISSYTNLGVFYDRESSRLWIGTSALGPMYVEISDYTLNPYNIPTYKYQFYGWLETDRFFGGQVLLDKDWESVTVAGDNFTSTQTIEVYWKDEGSTDWESLGTVTSDGQELRWSTVATRPAGKWIKLGLRVHTRSGTETPRVRAVVVKFLPMVMDRIRDTLTITLSDYIEHADRTVDTYTMAQQVAHLQSLIARVPPTIYQDPYGTQYEVHIVDYGFSIPKFTQKLSTQVATETELTLVLEQVPDTTYA